MTKDKELNKKIGKYLLEKGFKYSLAGFAYTTELIKLYIGNKSGLTMVRANSIVGDIFNVNKNNISRCVGYSIRNSQGKDISVKEFVFKAVYELEVF